VLRIIHRIPPRFLVLIALVAAYYLLVQHANRQNRYPYGDWHSEIYADKAGYYIYLPAAFIHGFNQDSYPEGILEQTGHGFRFENGKLFTKYPMGVAVMVTPFFFLAHLLSIIGGRPPDGFSMDYYEMTYYASTFYFLLGALALWKFLRRRKDAVAASLALALVLFGTNVWYYTIREPLMSHIYSFALFSLLLLLADRLWAAPGALRLAAVVVVAALILLVRPFNAVFLPVAMLLGLNSPEELKSRLRFLVRPLHLGLVIAIPLLVFLPQMIYWDFISGSPFFYSYQGESFSNLAAPRLAAVLFAPNNGMLPYTPAFLAVIAGFAVMIVRRERDRWLAPAVFIVMVYLVASWHSFSFGCGFGQRPFVEYLALFALPLASLAEAFRRAARPWVRFAGAGLLALLIYHNIALGAAFDKCHHEGDWHWKPYRELYRNGKLFPFHLANRTTQASGQGGFSRSSAGMSTTTPSPVFSHDSSRELPSRVALAPEGMSSLENQTFPGGADSVVPAR
jgi:hypothetical protein